jgi:hypothetical protein
MQRLKCKKQFLINKIIEMRNFIKFASVLALVMSSFAFGQTAGKQVVDGGTKQNDETRVKLATMMATMKDNLSVVYVSGITYETFRSQVLGRSGAAVTTEGEALLGKVYNYLVAGKTSAQIIGTDDGIIMAKAYVKLNSLGVNKEYALFSTLTDSPKLDINFQTYQHQSKGGSGDYILGNCKWYQIGCWIDDIFGAGTMAALLPILLVMLAAL